MEYTVRIVCSAKNYTNQGNYYGSGVSLGNHLILTNYHVISIFTTQVRIFHQGTRENLTFKRIVGYSIYLDLCLFEILEDIPGLPLGEILPPIGTEIEAIGYAGGINLVPAVIKSNIVRYSSILPHTQIAMNLSNYASHRGMSGGPILYDGKLIGLHHAGANKFAFCIPLFSIRKMMEVIKANTTTNGDKKDSDEPLWKPSESDCPFLMDTVEVDRFLHTSYDFTVDVENHVRTTLWSKVEKSKVWDYIGNREIRNGCLNLRDFGFTVDNVWIAFRYLIMFIDTNKTSVPDLPLYPLNFMGDDQFRIIGQFVLGSGSFWNDRPTRGYIMPRIIDVLNDENSPLKGKTIISHHRVRDIVREITIIHYNVPVKIDLLNGSSISL